jgi:hypothetical protein
MQTNGARPREPRATDWIRSRWLVSGFSVVAVPAILIGLVLGVLQGSLSHESLFYQAAGGIIAVSLVAGVLAALVYFEFVRAVDVSGEGIRFLVGRRTLHVQWEDLVPPRSPFLVGITFKYKVGSRIAEEDGLFVTRDQARAILTNPHCPNFRLDGKVSSSLGLTGSTASKGGY